MSVKRKPAQVVELNAAVPRPTMLQPYAATLTAIASDGTLSVCDDAGRQEACDWLVSASALAPRLEVGAALLVQPLGSGRRSVVLGLIGRYPCTTAEGRPQDLTLESAQSLSLKCGASSIDLRADGKVLIRGEDVLVRAKKTKRIRAGTVSIN